MAHRRARELSGGFQQKLDVALALLSEPEVVVLDEPFSDVDEPSRVRILELVADHAADGGTVLLSSHNRDLVDPVVDSTVRLQDGTVRSP